MMIADPFRRVLQASALAMLLTFAAACDDDAEDAAEETGEAIEEGAEGAADAVEDAAE